MSNQFVPEVNCRGKRSIMKNKDLKEVAIYILQLEGDPVDSSGTHIIEVAGVSLDKRSLERIKKEKARELKDLVDEDDDYGFVTYVRDLHEHRLL